MDKKKVIDFVREQNISELFKIADETKLSPICIPSYKFRQNARLIRHNPFSKDVKVFIFVYENDYYESGYDSYNEYEGNIEIVKISKKDFNDNGLFWKGLSPKRIFIQRYMKRLGIKNYFMLDDDVPPWVYFSYKQRKNKCKSCDLQKATLENALKVIQLVGKEHLDYKLISVPYTEMRTQFFKFDKDICESAACQIMYFNDFPENIEFRNEVGHSEDYSMFFTLKENGYKSGVVPFIAIVSNVNNTVNNNELMAIRDYELHPEYIDLKVNIYGVLRSTISYVKAIRNHPKEIDEKLLAMCKSKDVDGIKAYVKHLTSRRKKKIANNV